MIEIPTGHDFGSHARVIEERLAGALEIASSRGASFDTLLLHSGTLRCYPGDDQFIPFRVDPDFQRRAPIGGPGHVLVVVPGRKTRLVRHAPADFWHDPTRPLPGNVAETLDVMDVADEESVVSAVGEVGRAVVIGDAAEFASAIGASTCPPELRAALDEARFTKTPFEIDAIREANRRTSAGFDAIRKAYGGAESELELFRRFLEATDVLETELPYGGIVGWDENAAVLHHQNKDEERPKRAVSLLVDAGVGFHGWAADVTRTWTWKSTPEPFQFVVSAVDALTQELADSVRPGMEYIELHRRAQRRVSEVLTEIGLLKVSADEAFEKGLHSTFFPHGLGHSLGLQVHDAGGKQLDALGTRRESPADSPALRMTRPLAADAVVTIEPGLYFIPMLLDKLRAEHGASVLDESLVETLLSCGGVRIEDNVACRSNAPENLTRPFIA